jgi:hypothetical protein
MQSNVEAEESRSGTARASILSRVRPWFAHVASVHIRQEEWLLAVVLLLACLLCLGTNTSFQFSDVFEQYTKFFGAKFFWVILFTRLSFVVGHRWQPELELARRLKSWLFGATLEIDEVVKTDLEVLRGLLILFSTLTVYTNVKVRIPLINPTVGDAFFQDLDHLIFGERIFPWLEHVAENSPAFQQFLSSVYTHGYFYMVVLVLIFFVRQDRSTIRWTFISVASTYISAILLTSAYPSRGPCFMYPERYAWLRHLEVGEAQNFLREYQRYVSYSSSRGSIFQAVAFAGIAAFPSLHVGHMVILLTIAAYRCKPYLLVMAPMTLFTFLATMAFGWHYAADALGGALLAVGLTVWLRRTIMRTDSTAFQTPYAFDKSRC